MVYDDRLQEPTPDYGSPVESYLETVVRPGDTVLVGQGAVTVTLIWGATVKLEAVRPYLSLDPAPRGQWNWLEEWIYGSCLQFRYTADEGLPGISVTLGKGMPLGGDRSLEADFTFRLERREEPAVEMTVVGLPWVRSPSGERTLTGFAVPAGRLEVGLVFSHAPDRAAVESALGIGRGSSIIAARWEGERRLSLSLDLAAGRAVVLDVNGVPVPGGIPIARQTPLVLAGRAPVSLATYDRPEDGSAGPRLLPLSIPLVPGAVSPDGGWALLWEEAPVLFDESGEAPEIHTVPWLVETAAGRAECLDGPVRFNWLHRSGDRGGWAADGRYVMPEYGRIVAVIPGESPPNPVVLDGPAPGYGWKYLSHSVSPDGRRLAWLEVSRRPDGGDADTMDFTVLDLTTLERREYRAAAPVRLFDGVYYETPEIVWLPGGEPALWRHPPGPGGLARKVLMVLDPSSGRFVERGFIAPDGKVLERPLAWTWHPGGAGWTETGLALGAETTAGRWRIVLVGKTGRRPLEIGSVDGTGVTGERLLGSAGLRRAEFSPGGEFLAVEEVPGGTVRLFRCSDGEEVRTFTGRLLGWTTGGVLWLVVPGS